MALNMAVYGGYPHALFVDEMSEDLDCVVCYNIYDNPHRCENQHNFCLTCIKTSLITKDFCPVCRTSLFVEKLIPNDEIRSIIDNSCVQCFFLADNKKCSWKGPLCERSAHLTSCGYRPTKCPLLIVGKCLNCPGIMPFKDLADHLIPCFKNIRKGKGKHYIKYSDGSRYRGKLVDGKFNGRAWFLGADHSFYNGLFVDGKKHGPDGSIVFLDGSHYLGDWDNDVRTGHGTYTWPNGDRYVGSFVYGLKQGRGVLTSTEGVYEGDWSNDLKHGQGKMCSANRDTYEGSWVAGCREGEGKFTEFEGRKYVGGFLKDLFHGVGRLSFPSGLIYQGDFLHNLRTGQGTMRYMNNDRYQGAWVGNNRQGFGVMSYAETGETFTGNWRADKRAGYGVLVRASGRMIAGIWTGDTQCNPSEVPEGWTGPRVPPPPPQPQPVAQPVLAVPVVAETVTVAVVAPPQMDHANRQHVEVTDGAVSNVVTMTAPGDAVAADDLDQVGDDEEEEDDDDHSLHIEEDEEEEEESDGEWEDYDEVTAAGTLGEN